MKLTPMTEPAEKRQYRFCRRIHRSLQVAQSRPDEGALCHHDRRHSGRSGPRRIDSRAANSRRPRQLLQIAPQEPVSRSLLASLELKALRSGASPSPHSNSMDAAELRRQGTPSRWEQQMLLRRCVGHGGCCLPVPAAWGHTAGLRHGSAVPGEGHGLGVVGTPRAACRRRR